jgi:hypothetical protein
MILQAKPESFFTNDAAGYARMLFAYFVATGPIFGLVVWFLRRGPDERISQVETDVGALGKKVDDMGREIERDRERWEANQREITDNQRDVMAMLTASARAIQEDIHKVDVRMARVEERTDIVGSLEKVGDQIVSAIGNRTS